eukprot:4604846-Amphidinium_carterae.1
MQNLPVSGGTHVVGLKQEEEKQEAATKMSSRSFYDLPAICVAVVGASLGDFCTTKLATP